MRAWFVLAFVLSLPLGALAQEEEPAGYETAVNAALDEFSAGRWAEARALFVQAHTLFPNARTLRGIGMAAFELGDYVAAADALEAALVHEVRPLTDEQAEQARALLARARLFVGRFLVPAAPEEARLYVDGEGADAGDWPASPLPIVLSIGEHVITIRSAAGRVATARVRVVGGEDRPLDIDLLALRPPPERTLEVIPDPHPPVRAPIVEPIAPRRADDPAPWVLVGSGLVAAVVGAVLLGVGLDDVSTVENAPPNTPWPTVRGAYDRAPILTGVGGALLGVGLAVSTGGLVWGLTASSSSGEDRASLSIRGAF